MFRNKFEKPIGTNKESSSRKIESPEDELIVDKLREKLSDYELRLKEKAEAIEKEGVPDFVMSYFLTDYKIRIIEKLLSGGGVDKEDVADIIEHEDGWIHKKAFDKAFDVIDDYVNTGGVNLIGGNLK